MLINIPEGKRVEYKYFFPMRTTVVIYNQAFLFVSLAGERRTWARSYAIPAASLAHYLSVIKLFSFLLSCDHCPVIKKYAY